MDVAPAVNKHVAVLEPHDLRCYERLLEVCDRQMELLRRAEAALEEAKIVAQAVENERFRLWQNLCEVYDDERQSGGYCARSRGHG